MPPEDTATFEVRFDECDAYGLINNPNLLRYLQEAGWRADGKLGLPQASRDGQAWIWMPSHTEIGFLKPVRYGDVVEVTSQVASLTPDHWQRAYQVRRRSEDDLLVQGTIVWRMADADDGRPRLLPDEIRRALEWALAAQSQSDWAAGQSKAEAAPAGALRQQRSVAWGDVDPQGRLNLAAIVDMMTDVGIDAGAAHGWTLARCEAEGIAFVVREHVVDYHVPARLGEALEVSTWLSDVRRSTGLRHYRLQQRSGGKVLADGHTRWVVVRSDSMRPSRLPQSFAAEFEGHIAD